MRPNPSRVSAFKNCFGTIWSVSTLTLSSGITMPECVVNGCMQSQSLAVKSNADSRAALFHPRDVEFAHVHEMSGDCGCRGHHRTNQMRPAVTTLAAFKIAVRSARATFMRRQHIGIHSNAHAAARVAPLESCRGENPVESFLFRLHLDATRARDNQCLFDILRHVFAGNQMSRRAQVIQPRICARADEYAIHRNIHNGCSRLQSHILQCALGGLLIVQILELMRIRYTSIHARDHSRIRSPGYLRCDLLGLKLNRAVKLRSLVALQQLPALHRRLKLFPARNKRTSLEVRERSFVRCDHSGARAAFDAHVANGHPTVHRKLADRVAAIFRYISRTAANSDLADDGQNDVLGGHTLEPFSTHYDVQRLRFALYQALRRQHVLDFARSNAKR